MAGSPGCTQHRAPWRTRVPPAQPPPPLSFWNAAGPPGMVRFLRLPGCVGVQLGGSYALSFHAVTFVLLRYDSQTPLRINTAKRRGHTTGPCASLVWSFPVWLHLFTPFIREPLPTRFIVRGFICGCQVHEMVVQHSNVTWESHFGRKFRSFMFQKYTQSLWNEMASTDRKVFVAIPKRRRQHEGAIFEAILPCIQYTERTVGSFGSR